MDFERRDCLYCGKTMTRGTTKLYNWKKKQYCSTACHCRHYNATHKGKLSPAYKGKAGTQGYVYIHDPRKSEDLPARDRYILEHRYVMEIHLGRKLKKKETVHHKNGRRNDNRLENLELRVGAHGPGATHSHCETCTCFEGVE